MTTTASSLLQEIPTPAPFDAIFADMGATVVTYAHKPVFTVAESRDIDGLMPGGHTKNLFLKDKHGKLWLVTALSETQIDLKALAALLDAGRFSFGKAALLEEALGVTPGSVTPLALMHDKQCNVTPVWDAALMASETLNVHPLRNDRTMNMTPEALRAFAQGTGHCPQIVDFSGSAPILKE
ncbi:MAG: prolyl-tRNA synthetase associated domain-containing protein [Alphaproteobacteria bacterium]|nr:prolyl-tRNA synthetase associated domain-containing protein [Alphaproteobacteria bacterium]